jgi:hypothetical protein
MATKTIITPVLRFWGFERHPFDDLVLRDGDLDLFVDRDTELRRLQNALSNTLCGVFGAQGIGKSSVLNRLSELTVREGYPVATVQMTGTSENLLYREILAAILREIKGGKIKVLGRLGLKTELELERVEASITYTSSVEAAGEAGMKAFFNLAAKTGVIKSEEHKLSQHTEDTAAALIHEIALHKKEAFVVVIDNLERAKFMVNNEDAYFRFLTKFAQTIDSTFSEAGVAFVVSLDQTFVDHINDQLPGAEEAYSFSFGQLVEIGPFMPADFFKIIRKRLGSRGWSGSAEDFIQADAFWALMLAAGGHPRRAFAVLREAMELIADRKAKKQISLDFMRQAARNCQEKLAETDLKIFQFLSKNDPHSSSDKPFLDAVGIGRTHLRDRLAELENTGLLGARQEISGNTKKDVYFLQHFDSA